MSKRVNFSEFERQLLVAIIKENAHIIEDKRTDKRTNKEKELAWGRITDRYNSEAWVSKRTRVQLEGCWKNLKIKFKTYGTAERKKRIRTGGRPAPAQVPKNSLSLAVMDILQKRFDATPKVYVDDAEQTDNSTEEETPYTQFHEQRLTCKLEPSTLHDSIEDETSAKSDGSSSSDTGSSRKPSISDPVPSAIQPVNLPPAQQRTSVAISEPVNSDISELIRKTSGIRKQVQCAQGENDQILRYRNAEHVEKMKTLRLERKYLMLEHKRKMELLKLQIENEKSRSVASALPTCVPGDNLTLSPI